VTGGSQDINYARTQIANGQVPPSSSITIEGLLNQSDVPVDGAPCDSLFCLRPAFAVAPSLHTGHTEYWIQLGMASSLTLDTFHRPPIDLVLAIDTGSSMSIDIAAVGQAAADAVGQLRADDRVAVVTYDDSSHVLRALGPVGDVAALQSQLRRLGAAGGSEIARGLGGGILQAQSVPNDPTRLRRVMLFSCGYPDVSSPTGNWLTNGVSLAAEDRIGVSFYGILLGQDNAMARALGAAHGGEYGFFGSIPEVEQIFVHDFDLRITPIAYDLHVAVNPSPAFHLQHVYGVPNDPSGTAATGLTVSTVFLSRGHGAMVARLTRETPSSDVASVDFGYTPESAVSAEMPSTRTVAVSDAMPEDTTGEPRFQSPGVRKAVALVNEAERMSDACHAWETGDHAEGLRIANELLAYLTAEATAIGDPAMQTEVELVQHLVANMSH
jgi:Ca-activated chloride channel family protein